MLLAVARDGTPALPAGTMSALDRAGLVEGGHIAETVSDLVSVMTDAHLVISIERRTADLPYRSTIWARTGSAVWGRPAAPDLFDLQSVDPIELPLLLAQLADVGRRPRPPFLGACTVPREPLDAALAFEHDEETSFGILVGGGVDPVWADRVLIAHDHRRAEWTVSSVWTDADGGHGVNEVTVLDAGPAGYWHLDPTEDGSHVRYTIGSLETVMRALRRCIPEWCAATV
jgi:hypothetical protein